MYNISEFINTDIMSTCSPSYKTALSTIILVTSFFSASSYAFVAPPLSAGPDQTIVLPTSKTTLKSSITYEEKMAIGSQKGSLHWIKMSGPAATIVDPWMPQTGVSGLVSGIYTFRIEMRDNLYKLVKYDDAVITVKGTNQAPTVNAGIDKSVTLPTNIASIQGSASDADGSIVSYLWEKIAGPTVSLTGTTTSALSVKSLVQGTYTFRLTVKDNGGATASDTVNLVVKAPVTTGVIHYLGTGSGEIYLPNLSAVKCGDTIAIRAGNYDGLLIRGLNGCAGNPITVTNSGGVVQFISKAAGDWGMDFNNSSYIVIKSSTTGAYGFYVKNHVGRGGLTITGKSSDFDVSGVHVAEAAWGITLKEDPKCDNPAAWYPYVLKNFVLHDNLIENTLYEGFYLGYYNPNSYALKCGTTTHTVKAARLSNVKILRNKTQNTGQDGIKLRTSHGINEIANNTVLNYGLRGLTSWGTGITVGAETSGSVHHNYVKRGHNTGIDIRSNTGTIAVYNNQVIDPGTMPDGTRAKDDKGPLTWVRGITFTVTGAGQRFEIKDNEVINPIAGDVDVYNYGQLPNVSGYVCNSGSRVVIYPGPSIHTEVCR